MHPDGCGHHDPAQGHDESHHPIDLVLIPFLSGIDVVLLVPVAHHIGDHPTQNRVAVVNESFLQHQRLQFFHGFRKVEHRGAHFHHGQSFCQHMAGQLGHLKWVEGHLDDLKPAGIRQQFRFDLIEIRGSLSRYCLIDSGNEAFMSSSSTK